MIAMNTPTKASIVLLFTLSILAGCSSSPEVEHDPYNPADAQRDRADKAQRELSTETYEQ
jgi:hypothetical protein